MKKPVFLWRSDKPLFHSVPMGARIGLGVLVSLYLCACTALWVGQRSMIFHPMSQAKPAPGSVRLTEDTAQFWLAKADPSTAGSASFCAPGPNGKRGAVAYFPGNAEPASGVGTRSGRLPGCDFYALDYPGYEGAPGSPGEDSIHKAADLMMARMERDGVDPARTILVGRSLGSGEATRQASLHPCLMASLLTPYESLAAVALDYAPWAPVSLLIKDPFRADLWAASAHCPAMILYVDDDRTIDPSHAVALGKAWNPAMAHSLTSIYGTTHVNVSDVSGVWTAMRSALAGPLAKSSP